MKVEVFVPLGSCICDFAALMEKVGQATSKYKDSVEVQIKSMKSSKASEREIQDVCVIVNGDVKLSSDFNEKELENAILSARQRDKVSIFE